MREGEREREREREREGEREPHTAQRMSSIMNLNAEKQHGGL